MKIHYGMTYCNIIVQFGNLGKELLYIAMGQLRYCLFLYQVAFRIIDEA